MGFQTRMRLVAAVVGLSVAAVLVLLVIERLWGGDRRPVKRVLLLTIDTLRTDALPFHGNPRVKAPNLRAIAEQNILFDHAYAPTSWTTPSFASIMTGLQPHVHGVVHGLYGSSRLAASVQTLAERMQDAGYRTARIGYNPYLAMTEATRRGFQEQFFYPRTSKDAKKSRIPVTLGPDVRCDQINSTPVVTERAQKWLTDHADEDFFLWLHYFDPHDPYIPPREWYTDAAARADLKYNECWFENLRGKDLDLTDATKTNFHYLYESEVQYVDHAIGQIVKTLKELNLYDDTLIVVTSDHGEEFWEHGMFGHAHTVYREVLHVPLIIKPSRRVQPRRVRQPVSVTSVYATILAMCSMARETDRALAPSLTPTWGPAPKPVVVPCIVGSHNQLGEPQISIQYDNFKFIRRQGSKVEELYDIASDPGEQNNRAATDAPELEKAKKLLEAYLARCKNVRESLKIPWGARVELDDESKKILKNHGYLR